jgi:hypothetical protein
MNKGGCVGNVKNAEIFGKDITLMFKIARWGV